MKQNFKTLRKTTMILVVAFAMAACSEDAYGPSYDDQNEVAPTSQASYAVTNNGAAAYIFNGRGLANEANPGITLTRGQTYTFEINSPGHPFFIKTEQTVGTGETYNNGVSNNGVASGVVTFTVPSDAPGALYYICEFHSSMTGAFTIVDPQDDNNDSNGGGGYGG